MPCAECRTAGWSTRRAPPPPRRLDRVPSMQVGPARRPSCSHLQPGRTTSAERWLEDPLCPATTHAARQSAERASPDGWTTGLCPPPLRPGAKCRVAGWSTRVAKCRAFSPASWTTRRTRPPPRSLNRVPSVQVRSAGRPACASHHPGRVPSAERPAGLSAMHRHHPGQVAKCRACKSSRADDQLPLPLPMPLDRVQRVKVRLDGRPTYASHSPGRAPSTKRPAGLPAIYRHCPGQVAKCRVCMSGQLDDPLGITTAQAGRRFPSGPLVYPPCTVTIQAGQQVLNVQVRPAGRPAGHCHHPGPAAECQACLSGHPDDPPVPVKAQAGRRVP